MTRESITKRLKRLKKQRSGIAKSPMNYRIYKDNPEGYMKDVLKLVPTPDQKRVLDAIITPPRRVLVGAGHSVGKSCLGAVLVNWWFDTRESIALTTAPTARQVHDILWKEVRVQRLKAGLPDYWRGPKIPRLEKSPTHFAHGFTARDATRFHGQHHAGGILILFDEAEGVEQPFWEALKTMLDDNSVFVAFYNPTGQHTGPHKAEMQAEEHGIYKKITLSCLNHPNIQHAEANPNNEDYPIPGAINITQLESMLLEDSVVVSEREKKPGDVCLRGKWYRPGPVAQSRCLGIRPTSSITGLWSELLWKQVLETKHSIQNHWPVMIGCDVGRYGGDSTVIFVRKGYCVVHVEQHVSQSTKFTSERLKILCNDYKDTANPPRRIPCMIDEGGIGGGVIDQADGYCFIPVNASCMPKQPHRFVKTRDELWWNAREVAVAGFMDVSRLPSVHVSRLWQELSCAKYKVVDGTDMIKISRKDDMKEILGKSPDMADAFNLTFYTR